MYQMPFFPHHLFKVRTFQMDACACDHVRLQVPVYALCLIPAIIHNDLWVKMEMTQPRCGADLTHAVSLIVAPLLNTNVHLLWLCRLNRCLVSIQSQILRSFISALFNSCFPLRHNIIN